MRLYPVRPAATLAADLAVLLAVLLLAWVGVKVHDAVAGLAVFGRSVQQAGQSLSDGAGELAGGIRGGFGDAAGAAASAPVIGGGIADALRRAGDATAAPIERRVAAEARRLRAAGAEAQRRTRRLATLLGWLCFGVPTALLLALAVPPRVRQVRRLAGAAQVLGGAPAVELARRAAYGLPYRTLARRTEDPLGDLAAGRYEALLEALRDDAGVPVRTYRR